MKKNIKKILLLFLITIFLGLFSFTDKALAQDSDKDSVIFTPQISIPGSEFQKGADVEIEDSTRTIGIYIKSIYNYLLAIVGLLAVIVLMASGIIWMTAAGNTERISQAKGWMTGSLTGLVLMLLSYVLLKTINPNLVNFRTEGIQSLAKIEKGCCMLDNYKDTTGMFTGSKNISMTMTTGALSCYYAAIELNEPGVKKIEELTKEEKNDIQAYMEKIRKFKANSVSSGFTKCEKFGTCVYEGVTSNLGGVGMYSVFCEPKTESECSGRLVQKIDCNQPTKFYYDILGLPDPTTNPLVNSMHRIFCKKDGEKCRYNDGDKVDETYCYNGICYYEDGKKGAPCGNDGGICVDKGHNCDKYPGLKGRENGAGGRSCGDGLKCCY